MQEYIDGKITAQEGYERLELNDGRKSSPKAIFEWYARQRLKRLGLLRGREAKRRETASGSPMGEATWTFEPVCPDAYASASPKVFIVGVEPNDEGLRPARRDMGLWFCTARRNGYWGNPMFYRVTLLQLRAMLGKPAENKYQSEEDLSILAHLRYLDLKGAGGGAAVKGRQIVRDWVIEHLQQVVHYWVKDRPDITVLQGGHAHVVTLFVKW